MKKLAKNINSDGEQRPVHKEILANGNLQVSVSIKFRGLGSRHKIVLPGSSQNEAPVIVALARAFRWQKFIDEGKFKNIRQLAKAIGQDESTVGKTLRLRWLAPGVVHELIHGGCGDVSLKQLRHGVPELWREQVSEMVSCNPD